MAIESLREYITSTKNEDSKRHLAYEFFKEVFKGKKVSFESDANRADIYIEGQLVIELKGSFHDFLDGFYQALHYKKKGLAFSAICVITEKFIGLWKVNDIPDFAKKLAATADAIKPANEIGRIHADKRNTNKAQRTEILKSAWFRLMPTDITENLFETKSVLYEIAAFQKLLKNLDTERIIVEPRNFIEQIRLMEKFFDKPIQAIHCFYAMAAYWDATSKIPMPQERNPNLLHISGKQGRFESEDFYVHPHMQEEFREFVEKRFVFTNEGSGLTVDYYFSRFDEVMAQLDAEYTRQHGIFFTDANLSKFAQWFVHNYVTKKLSDKYIVFDPAGGSGNLVTSWRGNIKHKIVSELNADLLKIIERRMKVDEYQMEQGFTIIPKTIENQGLNFLDRSAEDYIGEIEKVLKEKNVSIDKPLAFLLNPPYKNTDENQKLRVDKDANYELHPSILSLTGEDAGKERYLAFLAQIINICTFQVEREHHKKDFNPLLMIFTPTSWLIPRTTYVPFRKTFDKYFEYEDGFLITSNEFFAIDGKWPLAFTIWTYKYNEQGNKNKILVRDFTHLNKKNLENINWYDTLGNILKNVKRFTDSAKIVKLDNSRGDIRKTLPHLPDKKGNLIQQPRYDYSTAKKEKDFDKIVSGFPLKDKKRHFELKRKCGSVDGIFVGLYDDLTPVRINQDNYQRMSAKPDRVWFRLDNDLKGGNKTNCFNGAPDKYGFCAYDLSSAKSTFSWYAITKAILGNYPLWVNQYDLWSPKIKNEKEKYFYALCFAFALSVNDCVVTKFEKDNPVKGAPEIFVDNPLCPANKESFWSTILEPYVLDFSKDENENPALTLINTIKKLYKLWNLKYCKNEMLKNVGLQNESYFKFFNYSNFVTPYSGLVQIRKYAEINSAHDLTQLFIDIGKLTKGVREEIYNLLVNEFHYFD